MERVAPIYGGDGDDEDGLLGNDSTGLSIDNQGDPVMKIGGGMGIDLSDGSIGFSTGGIYIDTDGK